MRRNRVALIVLAAAKAGWGATRAWQQAVQAPWIEPEWDRLPPAMQGMFVEVTMDAMSGNQINAGMVHHAWSVVRRAEGWKPGPAFDPGSMTDPRLRRVEENEHVHFAEFGLFAVASASACFELIDRADWDEYIAAINEGTDPFVAGGAVH